MILAWVIVGSFYVLASLGAKGHLPDRLGVFLTSIIAISLALHVCVRFLAPNSSQILLPIATLLNGVGYVEIARWDPQAAGYQALWFLISAGALVATLILVRRVRDLDRYRYLTLLAAHRTACCCRSCRTSDKTSTARDCGSRLGPISFQPVEIAKILLVFFFASYFAANRELLSTPTQRIGRRQIVPPKVLLPILFAWGFSMAILGAENDIGFALLLFALFISMLWVTTGLKTYVVLGMGLFAGGMYVAARYFTQVHLRITDWLNPWAACALRDIHQTCQLAWGWYSLAAGGMTGTGLGLGQSGNIPVPHVGHDLRGDRRGARLPRHHPRSCVSSPPSSARDSTSRSDATSDYVRLAATGLTALMGFQAFFIMAGVLAGPPLHRHHVALRRLRRQFALRELPRSSRCCCESRTRTASIDVAARSSP